MDERKESSNALTPHLIVVPNRIPPAQKDLSNLSKNLEGLNVILSPSLSDLSLVRQISRDFQGLKNSKNTRFYQEFVKLGNFIIDYVLSGKLDKIFSNQNKK